MKRLHTTGIIILDGIDILCISFSAGAMVAYGLKRYRNYRITKGNDTLVNELKRNSPINTLSEEGKVIRLPVIRGGDRIQGFSLMIKNKKLAQLLLAIINARKSQRRLKLLQDVLFILNSLLTTGTGFRIAAGGSLSFVQIILIALPSSIGGFLMGTISAYPLASAILPIAIMLGREIEDVVDPVEKCKIICQAAEKYHNKKLRLEMKNIDSLLTDPAAALQLPIDKAPLLCVEEKLSLLERYKLKQIVKSAKARKRVQHFSEFIKKFPECGPDTYEEVIEKIGE